MRSQTHSLTAEERRAYEEDGFFVRQSVFSLSEIEELRDAAERVVSRMAACAAREGASYSIDGNRYCEVARATLQFEHRPASKTLRVIEPFHHIDPRFDRLIDDPRLVEPVRDLIGTERVALYTDKLNLKRPREGSAFRWHQDSPYWVHFCPHVDQLPNAMLALDDALEENGCLRVIRGSHRAGCLPGIPGDAVLDPLFTDERYLDLSKQAKAEMPAGSLLFFSPHTVHGSEVNASDRARRALIYTYQPAGHRMFKIDRTREAGASPLDSQRSH